MPKFYLIILLTATAQAWGHQIGSIEAPLPAPIEKSWDLGISFEVPSLDFNINPNAGNGVNEESNFSPNESIRAGIDGSYNGYRFSFSLPLPQDQEIKDERGDTHHFDLMLGHRWKSYAVDFYYQKYRGFYLEDNNKAEGVPYKTRPDIRSQFYGANIYYSFSPDRFALDSLNNQSLSEKSGGSWIALMSMNDFRIEADQSLVKNESLYGVKLQTLAVGGGYGYRWSKERHVVSGQILYGIGPQWQGVQREAIRKNQVRLGQSIAATGGYAYLWSEWRAGLTFKFNSVSADIGDDDEVKFNGLSAKVFAARIF